MYIYNHWVILTNEMGISIVSGWWFPIFFYFYPYRWKWSNLTGEYFSDGMVQPPTRLYTYNKLVIWTKKRWDNNMYEFIVLSLLPPIFTHQPSEIWQFQGLIDKLSWLPLHLIGDHRCPLLLLKPCWCKDIPKNHRLEWLKAYKYWDNGIILGD